MTARRSETRMDRRGFLRAALAAAAAPQLVPATVLGRGGRVAPGDRIVCGVIGLGDRGRSHLQGLLSSPDAQVAAVCDVYRDKAEESRLRVDKAYAQPGVARGGCAALQDFRELLAQGELDAVFIAAPEHWHAVMAVKAMRAGKDVYGEKALALTVAEGRAVCDAVRRLGRVFQAGTQQRSDARFRFACELARNGYLGRVHTAWVGVPGGRALPVLPVRKVPEELNYELWLGPSPARLYRDGLCTFNWYFVSDYCAGWIQSWGVHHLDIALWGVPALHASTLRAEGTAVFPDEGAADTSITWKTRLTAPDGVVLDFCSDGEAKHGHGCRFEGDQGWVHVTRGGIAAGPKSLLDVVLKPGDEHLYPSRDHQADFLACMRTRRDPAATAEMCHRATTVSLVADLATRAGRPLVWDWRRERFEGDEPMNRMLSRSFRSPWTL